MDAQIRIESISWHYKDIGYPVANLQIKGPEGNRDYGFVDKIPLTDLISEFIEAIENAEPTLKSLAKTDKRYVPCTVEALIASRVEITIGNEKITVYRPELCDYLKKFSVTV